MEMRLIFVLMKIGIALLIAGTLGRVTYSYAVSVAHEQQFGLLNLGKFSRSLEAGKER